METESRRKRELLKKRPKYKQFVVVRRVRLERRRVVRDAVPERVSLPGVNLELGCLEDSSPEVDTRHLVVLQDNVSQLGSSRKVSRIDSRRKLRAETLEFSAPKPEAFECREGVIHRMSVSHPITTAASARSGRFMFCTMR